MSAKRKTTQSSSSSSTNGGSKRAHAPEIARAIDRTVRLHGDASKAMQKNIDAYTQSVDAARSLYQETLRQADEAIQDRERRIAELDDTITYEERNGKIKIKQNLEEFGLVEARKILLGHAMEPIQTTELDELRSSLTAALADREVQITKAVEQAIKQEKAINKAIQDKLRAECALKLAQTEAQLESKVAVIASFQDRLEKGEQALAAQRDLTKDVADAASRTAPNIYTGGPHQILLGMPFADRLGWNLEKPCQEWKSCTFEGTRLMKLDLYSLNLTELPSELGQLTNLQTLWCSHNELTELPSELGNLTNLQVLWCHHNELTELPSELGNLTNLQKLWCDSNRLTELPSELGQLTNLQTLSCHRNELTELPSELGQLTNLQKLWCDSNRLTELPSELGHLTNLQKMWCHRNQLTELPSELGQLTNLQKLWCDSNRLTELPSELGHLTNLQKMWCSHNRLTELPSELGNLTNLQELSCSNNQLTELPPHILALKDSGCTIYQ